MDHEWDPATDRANVRKHGVRFADAVIALDDELALTILDPDPDEEERFVSMGMDATGRVRVTIHLAWEHHTHHLFTESVAR